MPVEQNSRDAYRLLEAYGTLGRLQRLVLEWLGIVRDRTGDWPTGYELFKQMEIPCHLRDLNSVRPQLTALKALGLVENPGRRKCRESGFLAWTWCPTGAEPSPPPPPPAPPILTNKLF